MRTHYYLIAIILSNIEWNQMADEDKTKLNGEGENKVEEGKEEIGTMEPSTSTALNDKQKNVSESAPTKEECSEERRKRMDALLNRKRKKVTEPETPSSNVPMEKEEDEVTKRRREEARQKILWETDRAKERAERMGPQGWVRPKSLNTNKEFLSRTIQSTLSKMQKREREDH